MASRNARANMERMAAITFAFQEVRRCFLSAMRVLVLMIGRIMTQEYTKTQIADTETADHTLTLYMSLSRQICLKVFYESG